MLILIKDLSIIKISRFRYKYCIILDTFPQIYYNTSIHLVGLISWQFLTIMARRVSIE